MKILRYILGDYVISIQESAILNLRADVACDKSASNLDIRPIEVILK